MSLRARLLLVLAGLAVAGLLVADVVTYAALRSFLIDRVDRTLAASARTLLVPPLERRGFASPARPRGPGRARAGRADRGPRRRRPRSLGSTVLSGAADRPSRSCRDRLPEPRGELQRRRPPGRAGLPGAHRSRSATGGTLVLAAPLDDVRGHAAPAGAGRARRARSRSWRRSSDAGLWLVRVGLRPLTRIERHRGGDRRRRPEPARRAPRPARAPRSAGWRRRSTRCSASSRRRSPSATASERRLRRFVGDASHELRTPLSAVQAYAELFERGARERPEDLARAMAGIQRESRRMGTLVDELLLLARLDQGRPLERSPVDLAASSRARRSTRARARARPRAATSTPPTARGDRRPHAPAPGARQPARQRRARTRRSGAPARVTLRRRDPLRTRGGGGQRPRPGCASRRPACSSASIAPIRRGRGTAADPGWGWRSWPRSPRRTVGGRRWSRVLVRARGSS